MPLETLYLFLKGYIFGSLQNELLTDCQWHCGNRCSPALDCHSQDEERWKKPLLTFNAHRGKHFCNDRARIPCSVGNIMDFIPSPAQANCHDMVGKLSISYCELHHSVPYLCFWLLHSWSHFTKQPTIQIGISCSAALLPQLFPLQRPPLQSP